MCAFGAGYGVGMAVALGYLRSKVRNGAPSVWVGLSWAVQCRGNRGRGCRIVHPRWELGGWESCLCEVIAVEDAISCTFDRV